MNKHLKLFANHTAYEAVKNNIDKPNVVMCQQENEVHFSPETRLIAKFNVTTPGYTKIMASFFNISEIEIDGVKQNKIVKSYKFNTTGEHIVKYTLTDNTITGEDTFTECEKLISVTIPDSVTTISSGTFEDCSNLVSVNIPNGVTTIEENAFFNCTSLTEIRSKAVIAPTINSSTFRNVKTDGVLYVPTVNTGYNIWMGDGNYYLGKYNWTKVEQ